MIHLLDANVLLAVIVDTQVHHQRAHWWFSNAKPSFATCPVTQGALLRLLMQFAAAPSSDAAWATLESILPHPKHPFWSDNFGYQKISPRPMQVFRQITDAWLIELTKCQKARLATFDKGLIANHPKNTPQVP